MARLRFLSLIALVLLSACTNADISQAIAVGGSQHVTLYAANGAVIGEWNSDGVVRTESGSDGWYFEDKATHKLVRISGTVVITQN